MTQNDRPPRPAEKRFIRKIYKIVEFFHGGKHRVTSGPAEKLARDLQLMGIIHENNHVDPEKRKKTMYRVRPRVMLDFLEHNGTTLRWKSLSEQGRNLVFLKIVRGALEQMEEPLNIPYSDETSERVYLYLRELFYDIRAHYETIPHSNKRLVTGGLSNAEIQKRFDEYLLEKKSEKRRMQNAYRLLGNVLVMLKKGARW